MKKFFGGLLFFAMLPCVILTIFPGFLFIVWGSGASGAPAIEWITNILVWLGFLTAEIYFLRKGFQLFRGSTETKLTVKNVLKMMGIGLGVSILAIVLFMLIQEILYRYILF